MSSWDPAFETGHGSIDTEHQRVFALLDSIATSLNQGGGGQRDHQLIAALQEYVLHHFAREEAYMLRVGCPTYEANARAHGEFTRRFADWMKLLAIGHAPQSLVGDIHREATAWIKAHIHSCDCALRSCRPRPA